MIYLIHNEKIVEEIEEEDFPSALKGGDRLVMEKKEWVLTDDFKNIEDDNGVTNVHWTVLTPQEYHACNHN